MNPERPQNRVPEADVLRAIACLTVVWLHATYVSVIHPGNGSPLIPWVLTLYQLLLWATPLFAVLSGFLLFRKYPEAPEVAGFWRQRASLVVLPFVAWSAIYWLVFRYPRHAGDLAIAFPLGQAGQRHLYFLAMVGQFYTLFPWIVRATRGRPLRRWLLPVAVATFAYQAFFTYVPRPAGTAGLAWDYHQSLLPGWSFYLVLGGVLAQESERWKAWVSSHRPALAGTAAAVAALLLLEYFRLPLIPNARGSTRPAIMLYAPAMLPVLWMLSQWMARTRAYHWCRWLSRYSFAVYLIHPLALAFANGVLPVPQYWPLRLCCFAGYAWLVTFGIIRLLAVLPGSQWLLGVPAAAPSRQAPPATLPEPAGA